MKTPKTQERPTKLPGISIVIAARNESSNLRANLIKILTQDYPTFEVIVIDDHSTDETGSILATYAHSHAHFKHGVSPAGIHGKKVAMTTGIQMASFEWILTTDADCRPATEQWLGSMVHHLGTNKLLLGYGPNTKTPGFLNAFSRFETTMTAIQYFSWALAGRPYMGVGRNLMYHKSLFDRANGFKSHMDLKSGDDDLFVQDVAQEKTTGICLDSSSFMYSATQETWQDFYRQKARHISTSTRYQSIHKIGLTAFATAQMFFYPAFIAGCLMEQSLILWCIFFGTLVTKLLVFIPLSKKLDVHELFYAFPFFDMAYSLYLWALVPKVIGRNPIEWKSSGSTFRTSAQNKQPNSSS